nr:MAG: ORF1 [TTV-like mini virus]
MAPYWQTRYWRRPYRQRWRRNRFLRWRTRKTLRRTRRKRKFRRRRYKVKRLKFFKRKVLNIKQWQPKSIRLCKIVGTKALFQGSGLRAQHNSVQYLYSTIPLNQPTGGGWTLMIFSLGSLYEDYDHLNNIWTTSNAGLPLVRFLGGTIKLYQSQDTDYVVVYDSCWPMVDTPHTHADSSPSRMLTRKHKIVVPSKSTKYRKKPYKKFRFKPPTQMLNRWYFQRDLCNTPLLMLTATAVNLTQPFAPSKAITNGISFYSLNTFLFQNPNFEHPPETTGYSHKILDGHSMYLYATLQQKPNDADTNQTNFINWLKSLIFLGNSRTNQPGRTMGDISNNGNLSNTKQNWGNPFYYQYIEMTDTDNATYHIYTTQCTSLQVEQKIKTSTDQTVKATNFQEITHTYVHHLTYNPDKDTGENKIYLLKTFGPATLDEPDNENLILEGFPLYNLIWGWTDFVKKLKLITDLDRHSTLLIKTKNFSDNTLNIFWPIDLDFLEGRDPYQNDPNEHYQTDYYNHENWYPKLQFQDQTINTIATSGRFSPKTKNYLQASMKYQFYFKWGGCPKTLEKAYDPCLQSHWPTPDNITGGLTIQNPNTAPETELYSWDWEKDYVKQKAISRIQQYTTTPEPIISITDNKFQPPALKKQEKETEEEEEKNILFQLDQLRKKRLHLELQCKLKLMQLKLQKAK